MLSVKSVELPGLVYCLIDIQVTCFTQQHSHAVWRVSLEKGSGYSSITLYHTK